MKAEVFLVLEGLNRIPDLPTATSTGSVYSDSWPNHAKHILQFRSEHFDLPAPHGA